MGFRRAALVLVAAGSLAQGCSQDEDAVPAACREGSATVRTALRDAPRPVRLEGSTPLSECIDDTSGGGELRDVGQAYVQVAGELADAAAERPNGAAALQLGYLVGALHRAEAGSQGVANELTRRLHSELVRVDVRSPAFRRGRRAGREHG